MTILIKAQVKNIPANDVYTFNADNNSFSRQRQIFPLAKIFTLDKLQI